MRLGRVKFEISYVVDLDNEEMVDHAKSYIYDDISALEKYGVSPTVEYCEDASLEESDIPSSLQEDNECSYEEEGADRIDYNFYIDGASRGNPGKAAVGVVITTTTGNIICKIKECVGDTTNNVAEYLSLITALTYAYHHNVTNVSIFSDSELLVKQMNGIYKVKDGKLKLLYSEAKNLIIAFDSFKIAHIKRELNKEADKLCNEALDEQGL